MTCRPQVANRRDRRRPRRVSAILGCNRRRMKGKCPKASAARRPQSGSVGFKPPSIVILWWSKERRDAAQTTESMLVTWKRRHGAEFCSVARPGEGNGRDSRGFATQLLSCFALRLTTSGKPCDQSPTSASQSCNLSASHGDLAAALLRNRNDGRPHRHVRLEVRPAGRRVLVVGWAAETFPVLAAVARMLHGDESCLVIRRE